MDTKFLKHCAFKDDVQGNKKRQENEVSVAQILIFIHIELASKHFKFREE